MSEFKRTEVIANYARKKSVRYNDFGWGEMEDNYKKIKPEDKRFATLLYGFHPLFEARSNSFRYSP